MGWQLCCSTSIAQGTFAGGSPTTQPQCQRCCLQTKTPPRTHTHETQGVDEEGQCTREADITTAALQPRGTHVGRSCVARALRLAGQVAGPRTRPRQRHVAPQLLQAHAPSLDEQRLLVERRPWQSQPLRLRLHVAQPRLRLTQPGSHAAAEPAVAGALHSRRRSHGERRPRVAVVASQPQ